VPALAGKCTYLKLETCRPISVRFLFFICRSLTRILIVTIYGYTTNDQNFANNQVTITQRKGADEAGSNDASGTLRVKAGNFAAYNLNVVNSRGEGTQAIALSAYAASGTQGYYGCKFIGYQDTILAQSGKQVYDKCYIEGATDFIFGQTAVAWFEKSTIAISGRGWITASGRDSSSNPAYYVINGATVSTKSGVSLAAGSTYLGRPWRNYARVVVQNSNLGAVVNSAGWSIWQSGDTRTDQVFYREYGNTGTGASGTRASFSSKLSSAVTLANVIGSTSWIDMNYWNNAGTVSPTTTTLVASTTSARPASTSTSGAVTTTQASGGGGDCSVAQWGQCGGQGYTGCTVCAAGTCTFSNGN